MRDVYLRCITVFAFFFNEMLQEWDEVPKPGLKPRSRPGLVFPLWGRTVGRQDGEGITLLLLGGWGVCEPLQGVTSAIITWDSFRPHNFNSKIFLFFFFSKSNCFRSTSIKDESHKSFEMEQHAGLEETINKKIKRALLFFKICSLWGGRKLNKLKVEI